MNRPSAWIVGGVLAIGLAAGAAYFAYIKPNPAELPGRDPGPQGQKEKEKAKPAPAVYEPAPLALADASRALYTGKDARQSGLKEGALDATRTAVLRGKVHDRDGKPVADVKVSVAHHPEYGSSRTDGDGIFDVVVNGGGQLCIDYRKDGFLPLCRNIVVPWQDYAWLPDVVLTQPDAAVTTVDLKADAPIQVARGSAVKDQHGERRTTLLIPKGTAATMTLPDGTNKELAILKVRATEFTVGKSGPAAMPAPLPPNSAYTYAVDLSADEAVAAGAQAVRFSKPLIHYVENFLKFPAGTAVPTGYFDPAKNAWVAAESGLVVEIAAVADGMVTEMIVGAKREAAGPAALAKLGITDAERRQLGGLYKPGQSLWRVPIPHFSFWDCNWGFSPPGDAENPDGDAEGDDGDCTCDIPGASVIGVQRQTLGETVRLAGTPFRLHYQSDRTQGYQAARSVRIKLSGPKTPKSLKRIELDVQVAGQRFTKEDFPGKAEQSFVFVWDGKDGHGRTVVGGQWAVVKVGWVYDGVYENNARFGSNGNGAQITGSRTRQEVALWREFRTWIGGWDARTQGLGGWTLNVHHAYDIVGRVLHRGDGRRQGSTSAEIQPLNSGIVTIAGGGDPDGLGNRGPAVKARLENPNSPAPAGSARDRYLSIPWPVVVTPAGEIYLADENQHVRHIKNDGIIHTAAGGNVTKQQFKRISGLALDRDGSLLIADLGAQRIYRLAKDGAVTIVAGTGNAGFAGDGGPAAKAQLDGPTALTVAADGTLYIADSFNHRIRRVGPDGIITTLAGNPEKSPDKRGRAWKSAYGGDGGPAATAKLYWPNALALAPDGSLYVCDSGNYVVRHISPTGTITTFAGVHRPDDSKEFSGDGGPALKAKFHDPTGLCLTPDGALLIVDRNNHRIRRVGRDGLVTTVAGGAVKSKRGEFAGDGGPSAQAKFSYPAGIACAPDGSLLIYDGTYYIYGDSGRSKEIRPRLRRVSAALPGFTNNEIAIPSEDGSELFKFDATGRHLETRDALTGALVFRFHCDARGRFNKVEDAFGNAVTLERDANGHPRAVAAPHGQRTALETDAEGYLAKIGRPGQAPVELTYASKGLLKSFQDERGAVARFQYDDMGRLAKDESPTGGHFTLQRRELPRGVEVSVTTALKPPTNYRTINLPAGGLEFINQCCCGAETTVRVEPDGNVKTVFPDGTVSSRSDQPDSRWGVMGRNVHKTSLATPGGRTATALLEQATILADKANPLSLKTQTATLTLNGRKFTRTFDADKRTITQTTPGGRESVTTLDEHGRVAQVQGVGLAPVRLSYDARGRLKELSQGEGAEARRVTFGYDDAGRVAVITDPLKRTTKLDYDKSDRPAKQVLADEREIGMSFDGRGNLLTLTPPGKAAHSFAYTPTGQLKRYEPPSAGPGPANTAYEFDKDRKLIGILRPDARRITLAYDKVGHLETMHTPTGTWKLDFDGRTEQLKSAAGPHGSLSFTYDGFLTTGTAWDGVIKGVIGVEFDNDFRVAARTLNGGAAVKFGYDSDGLLTSVGRMSSKRDPKSGLVRATNLGQVETALDYNAFGERMRFSAQANGKEMLVVVYERDALGRITKKTETLQGKTDVYGYGYDRAGRLTDVTRNGAKVSHYEYDANGNRLKYEGQLGSFAGSYDAQDRVSNYGPFSFTHTAAGEWLTKTEAGKTTGYDYDVLGNLRAVALPDGVKIEYLVDAANRRIGKKLNGKLVQGFLWQDQLRPAAELDGAGKVASRFIYAGGVNVPSYMEKAGKTYRLITDHLGSPRLVIDAASGEIAQRLDYDEFGNVLLDSSPGFQPFGFAGGLYEPQTKLVRFGARDYDAASGRWTKRDPILFWGGQMNFYAYVTNDPINKSDPPGLTGFWGNVWESFRDTNTTVPGLVAPTGLGFATAGTVGAATGTLTWGQAFAYAGSEAFGLGYVPPAGPWQWTVSTQMPTAGAAFESAAFTSLVNFVAVGLAWEAGVLGGSLFNAGYESAAGQSLGEDWADMQFDPAGHGRSFGEWYRCLWPGASGCPPSGSRCCSGPARAGDYPGGFYGP